MATKNKLLSAALGLGVAASGGPGRPDPGVAHAVVKVGGATGSFVSTDGLVLTKHHVAFGVIQFNSSAQRDLRLRPAKMQALIAYREQQWRVVYPDANATLRISYGKVTPLQARCRHLRAAHDDRRHSVRGPLTQAVRVEFHAIGRSRGIAVRGRQDSHGFHDSKDVVRRRFPTSLRRSP